MARTGDEINQTQERQGYIFSVFGGNWEGEGNHWGCGQRKGGGGRGSKGQERENTVRALQRNVICKGC